MSLSVVIPVYNEHATVKSLLERVQRLHLAQEIIVVDDGSTDGTGDILVVAEQANDAVRVIRHRQNRGKGAAVRTGLAAARGDVVIIQDADLEYSPDDYPALLEPLLTGRAQVVYGSRLQRGRPPGMTGRQWLANWWLTRLTRWLTGLPLTDMETCYKAFRRCVVSRVSLKSERFGFEPEFTVKVAKRRFRFEEVPVRYHPRPRTEGKKIGWKDGVVALMTLVRFGLFD